MRLFSVIHLGVRSYLSAEMKSVFSSAKAELAEKLGEESLLIGNTVYLIDCRMDLS